MTTPADGPDRNFGFLLYDAARLMRRNFDRRARQVGLTRAQWSVLAHLARNEGVRQCVLADILDVKPITLARQVDRLEAGGWVQRRPDPEDRRAWTLHLADKAHPILERLRELGRATRAEALVGLSTEQRQHLIDALARIRDNLAAGETQVTQRNEPATS